MVGEIFTSCTSVAGGTSVDKVLRFTSFPSKGVLISENSDCEICWCFPVYAGGVEFAGCLDVFQRLPNRPKLLSQVRHTPDAPRRKCSEVLPLKSVVLRMPGVF